MQMACMVVMAATVSMMRNEHHYYLTLGFEGLPGFLPGFLPLLVNLILFQTMLPSTSIIPNFVTLESFHYFENHYHSTEAVGRHLKDAELPQNLRHL